MKKTSALVMFSVVCALGAGCAEWDAGAYMPATFTTDYAKIATCAKSPTHGAKYVETYVQKEHEQAWKDGKAPYAKRTVFAKIGYDDSKCADTPSKHWAMRKTADEVGKWEWQMLDGDGVIEDEGQISMCSGCHSASAYVANDWVATTP